MWKPYHKIKIFNQKYALWPVWICTFILTLALSLPFSWLPRLWVDRITDGKAAYLSIYYNYKNALTTDLIPGGNSRIVLISTSDFCSGHEYSRSEIANLLDSVYKYDPSVIGVDLLFPESIETTSEEDRKLYDAVDRCKDRLVVAAWNYQGDSLRHSFFTLPTGVDYGTVNSQSYYGLELADHVGADGREVEKLVVKLARKSGTLVSEEELKEGIVNYTSRNFNANRIRSFQQLTPESIGGKVVLIGEFSDTRDIAQLPFLIQGVETLPGTMVAAYQLNSIMKPSRLIHHADIGSMLILNVLFLFFYSLFFVLLSIKENIWIDGGHRRWAWKLLAFMIKPVVLFVFFISCVYICGVLISSRQVMVDMTLFVIAQVLVIDWATKVSLMLFKRIQS